MTRRGILAAVLATPAAVAQECGSQQQIPAVQWAQTRTEAGEYGLLVRLYSAQPEVEAFVATIRYRLAGETIIREHRRVVLRVPDPGVTTDFSVATSGPAAICEMRVRQLALAGAEGELSLSW